MEKVFLNNLLGEYEKYELSLIDDRSNFPLSLKNYLLPLIKNDLASIKDDLKIDFLYDENEIYKHIQINFGGSLKRFFASIKRDVNNENDEDILTRISAIERNRNLIDVCHKNPNNNRLSNDIDHYIYKVNFNNEKYREKRVRIKKEIALKIADTSSTYVATIQTDIFGIAESTLPNNVSSNKGHARVNKIPGITNIYTANE
jgi:hypothetical protein